jgi:hypothetical protein
LHESVRARNAKITNHDEMSYILLNILAIRSSEIALESKNKMKFWRIIILSSSFSSINW